MSPVDALDYQSALAYLVGRINYEQTQMPYRLRSFKLARMERLLTQLGDPHIKYPAVHIAGTKGKGSTAVMIDAVLRAAGYRTGLYTSPHLERIEERFVVEGEPCDTATFVNLVQRVRPAVEACEQRGKDAQDEDHIPTYFEITTAMAMLLFAGRGVDIAVLEVGLGGRLDSTNVCRPVVSIITSISFDHMQQLGNTLAAIAGEKAGIIKPGVPVVSGVTGDEAASVIRAVARTQNCSLVERSRDFDFDTAAWNSGPALHYWHRPLGIERNDLALALRGAHQAANAAVALAAIDTLRASSWAIDETAIRSGLASAHCGARIEVVSEKPTIILDAAHNVASVQALVDVLARDFAHHTQRTLVFATSRDKDASGMLELLVPIFDRVLITRYQNNLRAADSAELAAIAQACAAPHADRPACQIAVLPTSTAALAVAQGDSSSDSLICIAGSFFLAAELRPQIVRAMSG